MSRILRSISLVLLSFVLVMCQKELSHVGSADPVIVLPDPVTAIIQGNILDEAGQPANGVSIKVGSQTAITDAKGYFRITGASLDKKASLVVAEKSGYFKAYRTFSATSGVNQVVIKLIKKTLTGTVDAATGGTVSLTNGSKVTLPANGIVVASTGAAFTGSVNVYVAYIDPSASDINQTIPGSFMANDKNGSRVTLSSFGMLAVDLESSTGERLQIKTGSTANLTTPIPSSLQSNAPSTIALWSVDEQTGLWKEEGSATKNGTSYVGDVKHFSFWNCDVNVPGIQLSMTVKNSDGQPLTHVLVRIIRSTTGYFSQAYGWTDTLGQVSGLVPSNEQLDVEIVDPCYNAIYSQNVGPFATNTNLGVITVTNPAFPSIVTLKGTLLNCSGTPVTNGYAIVSFNNMVRYASVSSNGSFITNFTTCSGSPVSAQVLGVDNGNSQQGTVQTVAITSTLTDAGNISACGVSSTQFINYTLDGVSHSFNNSGTDSLFAYTTPQQGTNLMTTQITAAQNTSQGSNIYLSFSHATATNGTYTVNSNFQVQTYAQGNTLIQPFVAVITNFPQIAGEFYEGSFSGNFKDSGNVTHTISGTFRVRRFY